MFRTGNRSKMIRTPPHFFGAGVQMFRTHGIKEILQGTQWASRANGSALRRWRRDSFQHRVGPPLAARTKESHGKREARSHAY